MTVQPLPILSVNNPGICEGQTATLIASGAETYLWSTGSTEDSILVSPVNSTIYQVMGSTNGCYAAPVNAEVLVDAPPMDSILISGNTLTAFEPNASYQWINCINNSWIPDATGQTFTPSLDGNYAVILATGNCVDTSNSISVLLTGIPRIGEKTDISISPNPTSGIFKVELKHAMENINLQIFNSKGQSIRSEAFANTRLAVIDLSAFSAGPYFIGIMADGKFYYTCVIKR